MAIARLLHHLGPAGMLRLAAQLPGVLPETVTFDLPLQGVGDAILAGGADEGPADDFSRSNRSNTSNQRDFRQPDVSNLYPFEDTLDRAPQPQAFGASERELLRAFLSDATQLKSGATDAADGPAIEEIPLFFPIFGNASLRRLLVAVCGADAPVGLLDIPDLTGQISRLRMPRELPRHDRNTLRPNLLILRDSNPGMLPFQADITNLVEGARLVLGKDAVVEAEFDGSGPLLPHIGADKAIRSILVVSDLHGFAQRSGWRVTSAAAWRALTERCRSDGVRLTILSPGAVWPTASGQEGAVAEPAHAAVFRQMQRDLPIVPWCEDPAPAWIRAFASGVRSPIFVGPDQSRLRLLGRRMSEDAFTHDGAEWDLAVLLTLTSDFDIASLRTLRLCLSDPKRPLTAYGQAVDAVPPRRPAGPLAELLVWTAPLFETRGETARYSLNHGWLASRRPRPEEDTVWQARYDMAVTLLRLARAKRGARRLIGDRLEWFELRRHRSSHAERGEVAKVAAAFNAFENQLGGEATDRRSVAPIGAAGLGDYVGAAFQKDRMVMGINLEAADLRIPLRSGEPKHDIAVVFLDKRGRPDPSAQGGTLDTARQIFAWGDSRACALRIGARTAYLRRPPPSRLARPLFVHRHGYREGEAFRFDGDDLIVGAERFSLEGFKKRAGDVVSVKPDLSGDDVVCVSNRPGSVAAVRNERMLVTQRDPRSEVMSAILLLGSIDDSMVVAGPGGTAVIGHWNSYLAVEREDATVELSSWTPGDRGHRAPFGVADEITQVHAAASSAGAVVLRRGTARSDGFSPTSSAMDMVWLEPFASADRSPRLVQVPLEDATSITAVAMARSGLVAVADGAEIRIYEPPWQSAVAIAQSEGGLSDGFDAKAQLPRISNRAVDLRQCEWHPADDFVEAELAACIRSVHDQRIMRLGGLANFHQKGIDTSRLARYLPSPPGLAEVVGAIWGRKPDQGLELLQGRDDLAAWSDPDSKMTLLHLAARRNGNLPLLKPLAAALGVNCEDVKECTPLIMAADARDGGDSYATILELGGNPTKTVRLGGIKYGVLIGLFAGTWVDHPVPDEMIEAAMDLGAAIDVAWPWAGFNLAQTAAVHGNLELFDRVLSAEFDPRSAIAALDSAGWSAMTQAIYYGRLDIVRRCLDFCDSFSNPASTVVPLQLAVTRRSVPTLDMLLAHASMQGGTTLPDHPDFDALRRGLGGIYGLEPENSENKAILQTVLNYGIALDAPEWPLSRKFYQRRGRLADIPLLRDLSDLVGENRLDFIRTALHDGDRGLFRDAALLLEPTIAPSINPQQRTPEGLTLAHAFAGWWRGKPQEAGAQGDPFELLAERGLDITSTDEKGYTALHFAAFHDNLNSARSLMRLRPDMAGMLSKEGLSALDLVPPRNDALASLLAAGVLPIAQPGLMAPDTVAQTLLPEDTDWEPVEGLPPRRVAGLAEGKARDGSERWDSHLPIPASKGFWWPRLRRRAPLPYREPTWLVETWWSRSDGVSGVSAECQDEAGKTVCVIDGTSPPLHAMNEERGLLLTSPRQVRQYFYMFCNMLRTEEGNFSLLWSTAKLRALRLELPPGRVLPPSLPRFSEEAIAKDKAKDGSRAGYVTSSYVLFGGHVFLAEMTIAPDGMVHMSDDTPIDGWTADSRSAMDGGIMFRERRER